MADDVQTLADKYRNLGTSSSESAPSDIQSLADKFKMLAPPDAAAASPDKSMMLLNNPVTQFQSNAGAGIAQGVSDVTNTGAQLINTARRGIDRLFKVDTGANELSTKVNETISKENQDYESKYGDTIGGQSGRMVGQTLATLPLVPARVVQGISMAARALPTVTATGERIAAPLINRLGAAIGQGGLGGGIFAGATSASKDEPVTNQVAEGILSGAVLGPVVYGAGQTAMKVIDTGKNIWKNVNIARVAKDSGISPSVASNIVKSLDDAGMTPADAAAALKKMGPKATLADLDPSLETEASGLAARGGKSTSILKTTYDARAAQGNDDAVRIFESKFGPKPDVRVQNGKLGGGEADKIVKDAETLTGADYRKAHASSQQLDVSGVAQHIDDVLESAVGDKAAALNTVKSYLYNKDGTLKTGVKALHEVRKGIDDIINKKGDALPPGALSAVENTRTLVDQVLKTNPQMLAADAKYAEKMKIKEGLKTGYDAITKGIRKQEFADVFDKATPEVQETIKKGMHAAVVDLMEKSSQGQLSGAERLFGKKDVNRTIFKHAFGQNAEQVLDDIAQATAFKSTERSITRGSQTAERLAVQAKYGQDGQGQGNEFTNAVKAGALDLATGSSGIATGLNTIRAIGAGAKLRMRVMGVENLAEGSADLLSRQGATRDAAIDVLDRVHRVESKFAAKRRPAEKFKLPTTLPAALGGQGLEEYKKR